jgi:hypothetical protein
LSRECGEADQVLDPERLELELGPELSKLGRKLLVEEVVAGHHGDGVGGLLRGPQPLEKVQSRRLAGIRRSRMMASGLFQQLPSARTPR